MIEIFLDQIAKLVNREVGSSPLRDKAFLINMHSLPTTLILLKKLLEFGADSGKMLFIGKPYSTIHEVKNQIEALGITWLSAPEIFLAGTLVNSHNETLKKGLPVFLSKVKGHDTILLDSGAHLTRQIQAFGINLKMWTIQLTSSGSRSLEPMPRVIDVGRHELKKFLEGPFIGEAIFKSVSSLADLGNKNVAVIGKGTIGDSIVRALLQNGISAHQFHGNLDGDCKSIFDVIIGATGYDVSSLVQKLAAPKKNIRCFSGSSWDVEFRQLLLSQPQIIDLKQTHERPTANVGRFHIYHGGCPVNFTRIAELEPSRGIAITRGLAFAAAIAPNSFQTLGPSIKRIHDKLFAS